VNYESGQAPTLEMRFSALDMPSPTALTEVAGSRYASGVSGFASVASPSLQNPPKAVSRPLSTRSRSTFDIGGNEKHPYERSNLYASRPRAMSSESFASDSLDVVHSLTAQFPGLPPRATEKLGLSRETSAMTYNSRSRLMGTIHTKASSNSLGPRKSPQPGSSTGTINRAASRNDSVRAEAGHEVHPDWRGDETAVSIANTQGSSLFQFGWRGEPSVETAATENHNPFANDGALLSSKAQTFNDSEYGGSRASVDSAEWISTASRGQRTKAVDIEAYRSGVQQVSKQTLSEASSAPDGFEESQISTDSPEVFGSTNASAAELQSEAVDMELARIKSVGTAPRKMTPTPTHVAFPKLSMALERHEVDTFMTGMEGVSRRDSGTLGYAM